MAKDPSESEPNEDKLDEAEWEETELVLVIIKLTQFLEEETKNRDQDS